MLKHKSDQVQWMIRITDIAIAALAFVLAYAFRNSVVQGIRYDISHIENAFWLLGLSIALHFFIYESFHFYTSIRLRSIRDLVWMITKAFLTEFVVLGSLVFLLQQKETSRLFFGVYLVINYGFIFIERFGAKLFLSFFRTRGYNYRRILLVGNGPHCSRVEETIRSNPHWGYIISGRIADPNLVSDILKSEPVDEVYFALDHMDASKFEDSVQACEESGIPVRFSLGFFDLPFSKLSMTQMDRLPVVTFYNTNLMSPVESFLKRTLDVFVAIVGMLFGLTMLPWIAYKIKKQSPGPLFYKGVRVGENGRHFRCYKFRTMNVGADEQKHGLAAQNALTGPIFKVENDPRVFPFGHFLRRTSLDEFPQFFNVFRGDMSVVGTRPPTPDEVAKYKNHYRRRLSIRPGITGMWQVSGRNEIKNFDDVLKLDLNYIDHWSLWLDIKIIFRTIWIILRGRGAF